MLAQQSGLQIAYQTAVATGAQAPAVRGRLSAEQALTRVLAGSGLTFRFTGANTVTIEARAAAAPAGDAAVLDTILVDGNSATTEGTGSYTTGVASGSAGLPLTLRETPQSVSVVTNQRIEDQGLHTTQQVLAYTTGVNSTVYETDRDNTWSRGQWVSSYIIDGVLIDAGWGFYSGSGVHSSSATYDHVEVVRGASGLLTGSGDPSAAIRIERKKADARELTGKLETSVGTWNRIGTVLDVQSPLNADASLRGRFVADVSSGDGFRDRYSIKKQTYYGTLAWDLNAETTLSFSFEHRNHDPRGSEWAGWPSVFSDGSLTNFSRSFSSAPWWTSWSGKQNMATARIDHNFGGGWTGNATLSYVRRNYVAEHMRFYGQPDPVTGLGLRPYATKYDETQRQIALDAQVTGPFQAFGREHVLNFGFHGGRSFLKSKQWDPRDGQPTIGSVFDWTGNMARPDWVLTEQRDWTLGVTQYAGYGSAKISIADPLNLIVGARYTDWRSDDRQFGEMTPYVGLVYDITPNISAYASYTSIFNPQELKDRNGHYLDPVQGKNKEIGVKGAWFEDRLNASLSWFNTYQDNVATAEDGVYLPDGSQAYIGEKGVSAKGIEFEVSGEVQPGLNLFFGAATMKARSADGSATMTTLPTRTAKLFATWTLPGQWDRWTVGGGGRWQNKTWTSVYPASGEMTLKRGGYVVADAMVRFDINDAWSAQLNINNLFDKSYYTGASGIATWGEPRNAMLSLVTRF